MKHIILSLQERARTGFTDVVEITYDDIISLVAGTPLTIDLFGLLVGDVVRNRTVLAVQTQFAGLMTGDTVTCSVGTTASSYTNCLSGTAFITSGVPANSGIVYAASVSNVAVTSALPLKAQFVISAGSTDLSGITGGKLGIYLDISRRADRLS